MSERLSQQARAAAVWKNARETVAKANRENATPIVMNTAVYIGDKQTMKRKMEAAAVFSLLFLTLLTRKKENKKRDPI